MVIDDPTGPHLLWYQLLLFFSELVFVTVDVSVCRDYCFLRGELEAILILIFFICPSS